MPDYVKIAATAQRLVTESGRTIELIRPDEIPADTDKPWNGSATPVPGSENPPITVPAVQVLPNQVRIFGLSALGESTEMRNLITYSEFVYIIFQGEIGLEQFTMIRDEGVFHNIVATQALRPATTTLLGFIGTRR